MPIIPNFLERLVMLTMNQAPAPTIDMYSAIANRAVSTSLRLGVFEVLRNEPLTAADIAVQIDADCRGIILLLDALEPLGYIRRVENLYKNTPIAEKWMIKDSPSTIAHLFQFFDTVIQRCDYLEETIRKGRPPIMGWEWFNKHPGSWEAYYAGMLDGARLSADEVVSKVDLALTAGSLLDVGGGHGLYSVRFCQRYRNLRAVIFDWSQALEVAKRTVDAAGMGDRITLKNGDMWEDNLGNEYDVVLIFNVIHMYSSEKNLILIQRVHDALKNGGTLVIMDQVASKGRGSAAKAIARLQGLQLFNSVMGQTYPSEEIVKWLESRGFTSVRAQMLRKAPSSGLVMGVKAG